MKILSVYFKNINSLAGESRIDFDKAPLADAGVFAITGVNGAGKSSILDAITLGLYGETFRFNKPADYVMTKGTQGCFSQVEFLVDGQRYRSSWQSMRDEGNEAADNLPIKMQLVELDGEQQVLAADMQQVLLKNQALTGMDFRRFTRSIVLEQGDFASFLNALDAERMDILERIMSQDIYEDYKQQVYDNVADAEKKLQALQATLASVDLMSAADYEAAELDLADQKAQLAIFKQEQTSLLQLQASWENKHSLEQQQSELEQAQIEQKQSLLKVTAVLEKIENTGDVLEFEPSLNAITEAQNQLTQLETELTEKQQKSTAINDELENKAVDEATLRSLGQQSPESQQQKITVLKQEIVVEKTAQQADLTQLGIFNTQLPEKQQTLAAVDKWLLEHQKDHFLVENMPELGRLKNYRQLQREQEKKLKGFNKEHKSGSSATVKNQARIAELNKKITGVKKSLAALNEDLEFIANGHTFEEMQALEREQRGRADEFTELLSLAKVHKRFVNKNFSKRFEKVDKTLLNNLLETKQKQIFSAENILTILEKAVYREDLTHKLDDDRHHLEYDTPCSLCGSKQHPYTQRLPVINDSKIALADQRNTLKALNTEEKKIHQEMTAYLKFKEKNKEHTERIQRVLTEWQTLATRLNTMHEGFDIQRFRRMSQFIKKENAELKEVKGLVKRYSSKKKAITKLEVWIIKREEAVLKREKKQAVLDERGEGRPQEIIDLESALKETIDKEVALTAIITAQLAEMGLEPIMSGKEDKLYDVLNQRRQDYQMYSLRQVSLNDELAVIKEKVSQYNVHLEQVKQQIQAKEASLAEYHLATLYVENVNLVELIKQAKQQLMKLTSDLQKQQLALQAILAKSSYQSLEEVMELLNLHHNKDENVRLAADLNAKSKQITVNLALLLKQLAAETDYLEGREPLDGVVIQLRDKGVQMEITEQEMASLVIKINAQQRLVEENSITLSSIEEHQQQLLAAQQQQQKIETESENSLRQQVRDNLMHTLMTATNRVLTKINGRYQVESIASDNGFSISIQDEQLDKRSRSVKSLSGGETFIVSLAMALGLSSIANNGRAVDSLFIDEGFGNLDAETLYTVVSTLEHLKTQGKSVGIISHVDGIKQRIKTQIELVKLPNGLSRLVVPQV